MSQETQDINFITETKTLCRDAIELVSRIKDLAARHNALGSDHLDGYYVANPTTFPSSENLLTAIAQLTNIAAAIEGSGSPLAVGIPTVLHRCVE